MKRYTSIPVVVGVILTLGIAAGSLNAQQVGGQVPSPLIIALEDSGSNSSPVTFEYTVPVSGYVRMCLYDADGRLIEFLVNAYCEAGSHRVVWHPSGNPSGVYSCVLSIGEVSTTRTLILR